jgi:hypothetical protein
MGQYWITVNLDKREFVHPHKLGNGLKLIEQLGSHPGVGSALIALCAAMPEGRGGGDFRVTHVHGEKVVGRWAGDRIALVGAYAESDDLQEDDADLVYALCGDDTGLAADWYERNGQGEKAERLRKLKPFRDVSELVASFLEAELGGKYVGEGWRDFKYNDGADSRRGMSPDLVIVGKGASK